MFAESVQGCVAPGMWQGDQQSPAGHFFILLHFDLTAVYWCHAVRGRERKEDIGSERGMEFSNTSALPTCSLQNTLCFNKTPDNTFLSTQTLKQHVNAQTLPVPVGKLDFPPRSMKT